ncbi:MAG: hypothetical protein A3I66_23375 [Burkholderiales bacterium RIFCSPLOWO2_02_FULL_57_36]|nr:MAG: hypothetical protein A3I66_23375 [Burkholderiales bacterium RIFCSPLOWO2_02_FULL_57_36]
MRFRLRHALSLFFAGTLVPLAGFAQAEVTLNAGAKLVIDSNVNGSPDSPSKANQRSDSYLSLSTSVVYYTALDAAKTRYFIGQLGAVSSVYNKFGNLDSSMLAASAGLYQQLSPTWSGQLTGRGFKRNTKQSTRDSHGFGTTLEIKKQLSQSVWIKGVADYEDNDANLQSFSYTGQTYGVYVGYLPFKDTFLNLGYSHNSRDFKSTAPFKSKTKTLFAEVSQRIAKNWYLNVGYAYMDNDSNFAGTAYTNHVFSSGVSFSY